MLKFWYFTVGKNSETEQGLKVSFLDLCGWILTYAPTHPSSVIMSDSIKGPLSFSVYNLRDAEDHYKFNTYDSYLFPK